MSEKGDRRLPGSWNLPAAALVLALLGASGFVFWWKMAARGPSRPPEAQGQGPAAPAAFPDETAPTTVYLPSRGSQAAVSVPVKRRPDAQSQAREIVSTILSDEQQGRGAVLVNVRLRELYLDASGTAYLDLSVVPKEGIRASAWEELLAAYALVNSLMQNVEEVKRVRFLLDGKEAQTLAGHVDLSRSYTKRMDLVRE